MARVEANAELARVEVVVEAAVVVGAGFQRVGDGGVVDGLPVLGEGRVETNVVELALVLDADDLGAEPAEDSCRLGVHSVPAEVEQPDPTQGALLDGLAASIGFN